MNMIARCPLSLAALGFLASSGVGQDFGDQQVITTLAVGAASVYATDLDGDGDADVLSASWKDDKIAWYENTDGLGTFGPQQVITNLANHARSVFAADLDGDGDSDVLSAAEGGFPLSNIAWYENVGAGNGVGGGAFGPQQVITNLAEQAFSVYATDLDGDSDVDVLSASSVDTKIAWYENTDGLGTFGPQQVITDKAVGARSVYAKDLDGDGDDDVLSASWLDGKIAWYENLGGGAFACQQVITTLAGGANSVYATDLDGDGDADVLSASEFEDKIAWFENLRGGCAFVYYCNPGDGNPGNVATICASGCDLSMAQTVDGAGVPIFQNGYLIVGDGQGTANPNQGTLCVIGPGCVGRYTGDVQGSGGGGTFSTDISNSVTGGPNFGLPAACTGNIQSGETWYFQYWHRMPGGTDTFSEAICITFH